MAKIKRARIVFILLLALWMFVIFIMSAQPAEQSSQLSGGIVSSIIAAICRNFDSLTAEQQFEIIHTTTFIVRKAAHFSEYFILGVLAFLVAISVNKYNCKIRMVLSMAFCMLYAISDEIHQYFVPGRACRIGDVCIDTVGSIVAIFLMVILYKLIHRSGEVNA